MAMAVCLAALALAGGAPAADIGANDDTGKFAADSGLGVLRSDGRHRAEAVRDDDALRPERPDDDPGRGGARPRDSRRGARRSSRRARRLPVPAARDRGRHGDAGRVRDLAHAGGAALPDGAPVRADERAEPAGVPAATVRADRQDRLRRARRGVPRCRVRRAQGRRPRDPGDRPRALAAGQRSADRDEQRLHLAGPLPRCARRLVPRERPVAAADGRPQLPPVSRPGDRPARARLPLAQGGLREPRPHQAGDVGRVPGDAAADHGERTAGSISTRWAGRSTRRR